MNKTLLITLTLALGLAVAGCGSTETNSSGTGDDDDDGGTVVNLTCEQFNVGEGLACSNTGAGGKAKLEILTGRSDGTATAADDPRLNPKAAQGLFAGMHTPQSPSTGQRYQSGTLLGVRAADALCSSSYSGAHACSNEEIYRNVYAGLIPTGTTGAIFQSGSYNSPGQAATSSSLGATCSGWTTASAAATGSQFDVITVTVGGVSGPAVKLTAGVSCAATLNVACCY